MKRLFTTIAAAMLAAGLSFAAAAEPLKVGVAAEPYPPFSEVDASGTWKGFEIDLSQAICKQMAAECVITPVAWDGIIPALTSGNIDMIVGSMSITDERKKVIDFSDRYYSTPSVFVASKGTDLQVTPEGMKGKLIGVQGSTTNADYAKKTYEGAAEIKYYNTQDEVNADLAAGRIDVMLADQIAMDALLKSDQGKDMQIIATAPADPIFGEGIGVGLRKEDAELRDKINAAIKSLRDSGEYDTIAKKYFDFDIYGPQG